MPKVKKIEFVLFHLRLQTQYFRNSFSRNIRDVEGKETKQDVVTIPVLFNPPWLEQDNCVIIHTDQMDFLFKSARIVMQQQFEKIEKPFTPQ